PNGGKSAPPVDRNSCPISLPYRTSCSLICVMPDSSPQADENDPRNPAERPEDPSSAPPPAVDPRPPSAPARGLKPRPRVGPSDLKSPGKRARRVAAGASDRPSGRPGRDQLEPGAFEIAEVAGREPRPMRLGDRGDHRVRNRHRPSAARSFA